MANLIDRVKNILFTPKTEWPVIESEANSIGGIYTGYVIPLALVFSAAMLLAFGVFGMSMGPLSMKIGFGDALLQSIKMFVMMLLMVFVAAWIINALAPSFDGQKNMLNAFKLAAYSYTASFLAGVLVLVPGLGSVLQFFVGLYSLYLLYVGLPIMMKNPPQKTLAYFVVAMVCSIVGGMVTAYLVSCVGPSPKYATSEADFTISTPAGKMKVDTKSDGKDGGGTVTIKGPNGAEMKIEAKSEKDGTVTINAPGAKIELDAKKMEEFAKQMEGAAKKMEEAGKSGDPTAALKALQEAMQEAKKNAPAK